MTLYSTVSTRYSAARHALCAALLTIGSALPAQADDTSVFATQLAPQQRPNILFVLDYSGSMQDDIHDDWVGNGHPDAKIEILKGAVIELLRNHGSEFNAGLGALYGSDAGGVRWPISDPQADASTIDPAIAPNTFTAADVMERQLDRLEAAGSTATVNALLDAALYFRGGPVTHDNKPMNEPAHHRPDTWNAGSASYQGGKARAALPVSYTPADAYEINAMASGQVGYCSNFTSVGGANTCAGKSTYDCYEEPAPGEDNADAELVTYCKYEHPDRWHGATYVSPISDSCRANAIVLISDGKPTRRTDVPALASLLGHEVSACEDLSNTVFGKAANTATDGNCGPELAAVLAGNDQHPTLPGTEVSTYTIGFSVTGPGQDYLKRLASAGNGKFFEANDPDSLASVLSEAIGDIVGDSENFAALSVDIDRASFSHDNRAYLNLFTPTERRSWPGNLKGYFIETAGLVDTRGQAAIVSDATGTHFRPDVQSFWSSDADGNKVSEGGASESLGAGGRTLLTYLGDDRPGSSVLLDQDALRLASGNTAISASMLGLPADSALRDEVLDWIATAPMGDPLHSQPVPVTYADRKVVYTMTNQGFLHAFDATAPTGYTPPDHTGGEEVFAFMPAELLDNLPELYANASGGAHIYGLDGSITPWHEDANNDGIVNGSDTLLLIFGMRRGGEAYYALDVTNPDSPRFRWRLAAGAPGFERMAQSWSRMSLVSVRRGTATERVLVFGGGYDANVLDGADPATPARGNAIYFIDADGDIVWSASGTSVANMNYAIPSDVTLIDSDSDELADRLYVGDLGGQVWRIDFDNVDQSSGFHITRLAALATGDAQPFFYPPSIALNRAYAGDFMSVALGSGNRTQPLDSGSAHALYMLRDTDIEKGAPSGTPELITVSDLYDATANLIESSDHDTAAAAHETLLAKRGWQVKLDAGEKSLSKLLTFEGMLLATTYQADSADGSNVCGFTAKKRLYVMDIADARPLADQLDDASADTDSRSRDLEGHGIPSAPIIVFPEGSPNVQIVVDKQTVSLLAQKIRRVFWHSK